MKNIYKLFTFFILLTTYNTYAQLPSINFCDNFDSYVGGLPPFTTGDPIVETSNNYCIVVNKLRFHQKIKIRKRKFLQGTKSAIL